QAMAGNTRLDTIAKPTSAVDFNNQNASNLLDPQVGTDAATKNYVDSHVGSANPIGAAGGALAGTYPNPSLAASSVSSSNIIDGTIVDADISNAAGVAYSKLNLAGSVANTDLAGGIAPSKISGTAIVATNTVNDLAAPAADFSMNTHKVTNVVDPVSPQDAATKNYVDAHAGASTAAALRWYDTKDYGAKSDLTRGTTVTVTAGNATITGTNYSGTATDAGKLIRIQAAGAQLFHGTDGAMSNSSAATKNRFTSASATFDQTCVGRWIIITGQFTARIIGVESATQLRLATPVSSTFSGATWTINED